MNVQEDLTEKQVPVPSDVWKSAMLLANHAPNAALNQQTPSESTGPYTEFCPEFPSFFLLIVKELHLETDTFIPFILKKAECQRIDAFKMWS